MLQCKIAKQVNYLVLSEKKNMFLRSKSERRNQTQNDSTLRGCLHIVTYRMDISRKKCINMHHSVLFKTKHSQINNVANRLR